METLQADTNRCCTRMHNHLCLVTMNEQLNKRRGHWFAVQSQAHSHVAFTTCDALTQWLEERAIALTQVIPEMGTFSYQMLIGPYKTCHWRCLDGFDSLKAHAQEVRVLTNGTYTLCLITKDDAGITVVNSLDPTVPGRKIFDIQESAAGTAD